MTEKFNDYPLEEISKALGELKAKGGDNVHFYQKFTCTGCGARQVIEELDKLYASGICEECGHETNIAEKGCNYMLWFHG